MFVNYNPFPFFLHSKPSLIIFPQCIAFFWRFFTWVDYCFKFSFNLKAILYIAKYDFIHVDWVPLMFYVYFQVRYCEDMGITPGAASRLFVYYGLASCTGRLVSGRLCDFEKVNTFYVYQVAELVLGTSMLMVTLATSYMHMIIFIVIYGFCDGVFITTLNVLLITCVSHQKVAVAIGWEMQVSSFFLASGPPVAGEFCADWNSVHCCEDLNLNLNLTQTCYEKLAFNTFKTNQKWDRLRQLLFLVRDLTCIKVRTDLRWIKDTLDSNQRHTSRYLCQTFDKRPWRTVIDQNQRRPLP